MLYIVRHGETDWNVAHRIQGQTPNIPLNENGRRQANELAHALKELPPMDICFCSPLLRAKETAQIIYSGKIIYDDRLAERGYGELEGQLSGGFKDLKGAWNIKNPVPVPFESITEMMTRIGNFLDDIKREYSGKNVLVITHNGVMRALRGLLDGIPDSGDLYELPGTKNCEILCYDLKGR
jgi:probable phosphoglycerate mutase